MQAKTKVSAEEMRQLTEAGIPAWQLLATAMHKSVAQVMKLAEQGKISGDFGVRAIVAGMEKRFGGGMDKLNKTLEGQWSNLKDNLTSTLGDIALPLMPILLKGTERLNKMLGRIKLAPTLHAKATIVWEGISSSVSDLIGQIKKALNDEQIRNRPTSANAPSISTLAGGLAGGVGDWSSGSSCEAWPDHAIQGSGLGPDHEGRCGVLGEAGRGLYPGDREGWRRDHAGRRGDHR
jgi:Tape measure protein